MRHNLSANLTKLFKKEVKVDPDDLVDDKTDNKSVMSLNSDIRENHLNSLMDKLLRGEETEAGFQKCFGKPTSDNRVIFETHLKVFY